MVEQYSGTRFIGEVSSNHYADLNRCMDLIDAAARMGCDAVKFQLFKVEQLFAPEILVRSPTHRARADWELPTAFLPELASYCQMRGLEFVCTPFYLDAVAELEPYVPWYKIASYELTWHDLLIACARTGKPVMLSTGMATLDEVRAAVDVLQNAGCEAVSLLHCSSAYPTPLEQANLAAIETLRQATGCSVGWSDHTRQPAVILHAALRWQAHAIEFHYDLDGSGAEYGSGHCWLPEEMVPLINYVRQGFDADGDGVKAPGEAESADRDWRADPHDGLRPFRHIRADWQPDKL